MYLDSQAVKNLPSDLRIPRWSWNGLQR
jgi:hypothetical protein